MRRTLHPFASQLSKVASALSAVGFALGVLVFGLMVLLVLADMLFRAIGNGIVLNASEFSGYALAAMIYLSLGYSFKAGVHIRITFLMDRLSTQARHGLEVLLSVLAVAVTAYSLHAVWGLVHTSYTRGTIAYTAAQTPLYLPQSVLLVGLSILLVQLIAHTVNLLAFGAEPPTEARQAALRQKDSQPQ